MAIAVPKHEPPKRSSKSSERIAYAFLLSGTISLVASIAYSSSVIAFVGLGLILWGALLLFIKPTKYVKASLLDSTTLSSLKTIDSIITGLGYKGKAIYLPPRNLKGLKSGAVFIPFEEEIIMPQVEEVAKEKVFLENPNGICLTPPGLSLVNLYEEKLGRAFAKVDLDYLQNNLPKLFIEDLEIAEDLEFNMEDSIIQAKITGSIYNKLCKEAKKLSNTSESLGCPLCSSIAIALTRVTRKTIIIRRTDFSEDDKTIKIYYQIAEE